MVAPKVRRVLMCPPTHFKFNYIINPHMRPGSVDATLAMIQWEKLVKTVESLDIQVEIIEPERDSPDMVFATDQGIVKNGELLLSSFKYPERQKESQHYHKWFEAHNFKVKTLPKTVSFEGWGNSLFLGDKLLAGVGFRAGKDSTKALAERLKVEVVPLELTDPRYYHLDIALLIINAETAFYYPAAFSENSRHLLEELVPNLIPLSPEAAASYGANSFVSGNDIIISSNTPPSFLVSLEKLGLRTHEVDVSEFYKSGGGIHCLINALG